MANILRVRNDTPGRRLLPPKACKGCGELFQTSSDHHQQRYCSKRCAGRAVGGRKKSVPKKCATPDCETMVRRISLCVACQEDQRDDAVSRATPPRPGPDRCGLPIRGGVCLDVVRHGYDKIGRATLDCRVHGERLVPIIRPPNFVRYSQRQDLEHDLARRLKIATSSTPSTQTPKWKQGHPFNRKKYGLKNRAA